MMKRFRRGAILLAAVTGLLVLSANVANAGMSLNHCEPLR
jgi:hypothetical protein